MFSGIVETLGTIDSVSEINGDIRLCVDSGDWFTKDLSIGDSISVNGVCLTLVQQQDSLLMFDVSNETISCSNLGKLKVSGKVNLERALRLSDRINGHLVTGHIDTVAEIISKQSDARSWRYGFKIELPFMRYICVKGSITIDGVSLTVNSIDKDSFSVNIIPHTLENTLFKEYDLGRKVNVEVDMLSRYLERLMQSE